MEPRTNVIAAMALILVYTAVTTASAIPCTCGDICVNETGWWRVGFNTSSTPMQHAIDNATEGETICIKDGIYTENVDVNERLTIKSENGSALTIVHANNSKDHVFAVTADYVNISGLTVNGATDGSAGIYLTNTEDCTISSNNCSNNYDAISLFNSNNNNLSGNNCSSNIWDGVYLWNSHNNVISSNNLSNNEDGFFLCYSSNNNLTGNTMLANGIIIIGAALSDFTHEIDASNTVNGKPVRYWQDVRGGKIPDTAGQVILVNCTDILVENHSMNEGSVGIELAFSSNITIKSTNCSFNNWYGISLWHSHNNTISNNNCASNDVDDISLWHSSNNILSSNSCSDSSVGTYLYKSNNNALSENRHLINYYGIYLYKSNGNVISRNNNSHNDIGICSYHTNTNLIYNNYFNNTNNAYDDGNNIWNVTPRWGTNIIGGSWLGGNYWCDYAGNDADGDGLGDTALPYNSSGSIQQGGDWHPLVEITCGDVNGDGMVDMSDVIDLLYYVGYPGHYTICSERAADVNCDTQINMSDVRALLYYVGYPGQYELNCCSM